MNDKTHLRSRVLAARDSLSSEERAAKNRQICEQLEATVLAYVANIQPPENMPRQAPLIAVYAAMRSEVDLDLFVEAALVHTWNLCFPCMVRTHPEDPSRMAFYQVQANRKEQAQEAFLTSPLRCFAGEYLTNAGFSPVSPDSINIVVVPLVAFDDAGHRLGYGGGNYDQLLPQLSPDALVVGVAFEEQRVPSVPIEPHDQSLSCIICA